MKTRRQITTPISPRIGNVRIKNTLIAIATQTGNAQIENTLIMMIVDTTMKSMQEDGVILMITPI